MGLAVAILVDGTAADDLVAGADSVMVHERIGESTTYQIRYSFDEADDDFPLLIDSRLDPGASLTIAVPAPEEPDVLVKGQIYAQYIQFKHNVTGSYVDIVGGDLTREMDREIVAKIWPASGALSEAITGIIGNYPSVKPDVETLSIPTDEKNHLLVQRDTDLRFVRRLSCRYGYWFWVTTDTQEVTTAHWKRPPLGDQPVAALILNDDRHNVDRIEINWDVERPNAALASQLGLRTKAAIKGDVDRSPLAPLGAKALADITDPRGVHIVAPADVAADLTARSEGALIEAGWFIRARGETSMRQLGACLHAHTLVTVNGIGTRHSGTYVVAGVRHIIDNDAHRMQFELVRNAWEG